MERRESQGREIFKRKKTEMQWMLGVEE